MSELNVITVPKLVFQQLHPEEAKVFRAFVVSGAFRLAMSAALAEYQTHCPTHEEGNGASVFARTLQEIAEVPKIKTPPPRRRLKYETPEEPVNKFLLPNQPKQ